MKKIVAIIAILITVASVQADLISRTWTSQTIYETVSGVGTFLTVPESAGDGANWAYEVWNLTDNVAIFGNSPGAGRPGWISSMGGYGIGEFNFDALEGTPVALRWYNNENKVSATYFIQAMTQTLADYADDVPPTSVDVTFDFAGQTWQQIQQVPEPATFSLIGLVGLGMIVARRRALRKSSNL